MCMSTSNTEFLRNVIKYITFITIKKELHLLDANIKEITMGHVKIEPWMEEHKGRE